ncbi:MAG: redox-sensing transcriptional repressor Rex [Oscillospiraceae bacterium]
MPKVQVSANVIRRLPRYVRYLDQIASAGVKRVSSNEIGLQMGLTASQIRQDFNSFGEFGKPGYGYDVLELRHHLAEILGMTENHTAVIIGAGNLGHALIRNFRFNYCGFSLSAIFDVAPNLVGTMLQGVPVYHIDTLEKYLSANSADVAILTLPASQVNYVASRVAKAGVRGIWNFTNEEIAPAGGDVVVENVHFSDSLLALSYYLSNDISQKEVKD